MIDGVHIGDAHVATQTVGAVRHDEPVIAA